MRSVATRLTDVKVQLAAHGYTVREVTATDVAGIDARIRAADPELDASRCSPLADCAFIPGYPIITVFITKRPPASRLNSLTTVLGYVTADQRPA